MKRLLGAGIGGVLLLCTLVLPPPGSMSPTAWLVAGVAALMVCCWISEALPIPATALFPLALFPLMGISPSKDAALPYADPVIFLFLGGFILGLGMQRWQLHRRIGLHVVSWVGCTPRRLVGGFLASTALLSMWVSNSATAIMMLPVALSVTALMEKHAAQREDSRKNLGVALMLAVAYGASIGGLGTLIGTPPNALLAAYVSREHGIQIGFAQWMALGVPVMLVLLPVAWLILVWLYPVEEGGAADAAKVVEQELRALGRPASGEARVALVFGLTTLAWILRPLYSRFVPGMDDTGVAILGAIALFILPSGVKGQGPLLRWDDLAGLPWGVLILFGGGLSLAHAVGHSGLAAWIGDSLSIAVAWPAILLVAVAAVVMIFFTEVASNTASAATFLPVCGALAAATGMDLLSLAAPVTLAASCGFMLPMGTPPNAVVFSSGKITVAQMARAGLLMNLVSVVLIVALSYPLAGWLFR
jgi:sodium-dependent dicarboxylate transporter 2/3/5